MGGFMGVALVFIHFNGIFHDINQPFWAYPHLRKPPYVESHPPNIKHHLHDPNYVEILYQTMVSKGVFILGGWDY